MPRRGAFPARYQRAPVEEMPFPERGTPGGHRDPWDPPMDPAVAELHRYQARLAADIARERQSQQVEQNVRKRRRRR